MLVLEMAIVIIAVIVLIYLVNYHLPMAANYRALFNWLVVIILLLWLMNVSGMFAWLVCHTVR